MLLRAYFFFFFLKQLLQPGTLWKQCTLAEKQYNKKQNLSKALPFFPLFLTTQQNNFRIRSKLCDLARWVVPLALEGLLHFWIADLNNDRTWPEVLIKFSEILSNVGWHSWYSIQKVMVLLQCLTTLNFQCNHFCHLWKLGQWYVGYSFKNEKEL